MTVQTFLLVKEFNYFYKIRTHAHGHTTHMDGDRDSGGRERKRETDRHTDRDTLTDRHIESKRVVPELGKVKGKEKSRGRQIQTYAVR